MKLIERTHRALGGFCPEIIIVGNGGADADVPGSRRVPDSRPGGQGPLAGLEAGLRAASNAVVFVSAGDMPFLSSALAVHLCELVEGRGISAAVPMFGGRVHPLCAAYSREIIGDVSSALDCGVRSMKAFLSSLGNVEYVEVGSGLFGNPDVFLMNVNSPEDLERARRMV